MTHTKVLFVVNALSGGGAEISALLVFHELRAKGYDVKLIAINRAPEEVTEDSEAIVLLERDWKTGPLKTILAYLGFVKNLNKLKPDLVVAHCELPELFCAFMPRFRLGVIAVEHTSNPWAGRKSLGIITRVILKFRGVVWVTVNKAQDRIWLGGANPVLIHNPAAKNLKHDPAKIREKVVFIGRLTEGKRPEWAINAAISRSIPIGVIGNGGLMQYLVDKYKDQKELAKFYGHMKNPWAHLLQDTLIVMPSRYEGDGLVAVEAIINGFPIVLADNQDLRRFELPSGNYFSDENELQRILQKVMTEGVSGFRTPDSLIMKLQNERDITTVTSKWSQVLKLDEGKL
jgi:glycosyltransferase involved in cell wall biosynthesis